MDFAILRQMLMLGGDVTDEEKMKKFTTKSFLLNRHSFALSSMSDKKMKHKTHLTLSQSVPSPSEKVKLDGANRIGIEDLTKSPNNPIKGKFFLCRSIAQAIKMTALVTVVEEPESDKAVILSLYNYGGGRSNICQVLPVGRVLAIQNPWFKRTMDGGFAVRVDNPTDVHVVPNDRFSSMFPGLHWGGEACQRSHRTKYCKPRSFSDWKNCGNKNFSEKKYYEALECYTQGLNMDSEDDTLLANRAATYMNLGCFHRARDDIEKVLAHVPTHEKGIFRKAKILGELKLYTEAVEFLDEKMKNISEIRDKKEFAALLEKLKTYEEQNRTGKYSPSAFYERKHEVHKNLAEFVGPVKIENIDGKGRGLIAVKDIEAGELLIVSKALVMACTSMHCTDLSINLGSKKVNLPGHDEMVQKCCYFLRVEPERGDQFYQLYAGPDSEEVTDTRSVDIKRIDAICTFNGVGSQIEIIEDTEHGPESNETKHNSHGIWFLPSYINHSCWDCNCFWKTNGDIMIVRAFKNISKGEEILISYVSPTENLDKRQSSLRKHKFICACSLCLIDAQDPKNVKESRKKALKQIDKAAKDNDIARLESFVVKILNLRAEFPLMNVSSVPALLNLGQILFDEQEYLKCTKYLIKGHEVLQNSPLVESAVVFALNILTAFIYLHDNEEILKWTSILKKDLLLAYGSLEVMEIVGKDALSLLQRCGIPFY